MMGSVLARVALGNATFYRVRLAPDDPGPAINQNSEVIPAPTVAQIRIFTSLRARDRSNSTVAAGFLRRRWTDRSLGKFDTEERKSIEGFKQQELSENIKLQQQLFMKMFPSSIKQLY